MTRNEMENARTGRRWGPRTAALLLTALFAVSIFGVGASMGAPAVASTPTHSYTPPSTALSAGGGLSVPSSISPLAGATLAELLQHPYSIPSAYLRGASASHVLPSHVPSTLLGSGGVSPLIHPEQSTATNWFMNGSGCAQSPTISQSGGSAQDLVGSGWSTYSLFNGTGGTPCSTSSISPWFFTHGTAVTYSSTTGGVYWNPSFPAPNSTHWGTTGDATNGSIPYGFPYTQTIIGNVFIFLARILNTETPGPVSTAASNGTGLTAAVYHETCTFLGGPCSQPSANNETSGVAVARTTNGGASWHPWTQVSATTDAYRSYYVPSGGSGGCAGGPFYTIPIPANYSDSPTIAYSADHHRAFVAWDVIQWYFVPTNCTLSSVKWIPMYSYSTDGGGNWSTPAMFVSDNATINLAAAFGPAPSDTLTVVGTDLGTSVFTSTGGIALSYDYWTSTNGGATFTGPAIATNQGANDASGPAIPDAFNTTTRPLLAVDNWSGSSYKGNAYLVWQDNQSGTNQGYPGIAFMSLASGGFGWSTPIIITPPSHSLTYYTPAISVSPNGTIWVSYFGVYQASGNVRTFGTFSSDGGTTWAPQYPISDTLSSPGGYRIFGQFNGVAATDNGTKVAWSDCRSSSCAGSPFVSEMFSANVHEVSLLTNALGVTASVSVFGASNSAALPVTMAWDTGSTVTVQVPIWTPLTNTTDYVGSFQGYSGLSTSTSSITTFVYPGYGNLTATYKLVPASWIAGTFYPYQASLSPHLTIDNVPVSLTPVNSITAKFNYSVASGQTYTLNATQNRYQPLLNQAVGTNPFATTTVNASLSRLTGTINGEVAVGVAGVTATVLINGTAVPLVNNNFSIPEEWGNYYVNGSAPGLAPDSQLVIVNPNAASTVKLVLSGAWIQGSVVPAKPGLKVSVDGVPVSSLSPAGLFNTTVVGGTHYVTATQPGYSLANVTVSSSPGSASTIRLNLTNMGWIPGLVSPLSAVKNGSAVLKITNRTAPSGSGYHPISSTDGTFNVSLLSGYNWTVNVTANGYAPFQTVVSVTAGNGSGLVDITLQPVQCTVNCNNNGGGGGNSGPAPVSFPYWVIAVVAVAAVAAILAYVIVRRRGGGGPPGEASNAPSAPAEEAPPEPMYGEGPPPS